MRIDPTRLWRRYLLALLVVLAMVTTSHIASLAAQRGSEESATVINIAGRQMMLAQRILFYAARHRSYGEDTQFLAEGPLLAALRLFEESHDALSRGGAMGLSAEGAARRAPVYFENPRGESLDARSRAFVADVREVMDGGPHADVAWLRVLTLGPNELLAGLGAATDAFEAAARDRAAGVRRIARLSFAAALLVLLAEAFAIFLPAQRAVVGALRDGDAARRAAERALAASCAARDQAEASRRRLEGFVKHMSHELRTPLNGVVGMLTLMASRTEEDDLDEMVEGASAATDHLLGVVNGILDLSKLQAGRMELDEAPYEPRRAAAAVAAIFRAQAAAGGRELTLAVGDDVGPAVVGDAMRVRQVLANLVGNAVKFGDGGILIAVERRAGPSGDVLRYAVEDEGEGIDPADLDRLFDPFEQARDPAARHAGGTGLGLPICRQLVELMGGTLRADRAEGGGSRFWFDLPHVPAAERAAAPAPDAGAAPPAGGGLSVLVVDDNRLNRLVARRYLERLGHAPQEAENGVEAVRAARRAPFDVILMDIQMPVLGGLEAARRIRAEDGPSGGAAIVALTANATSEDRAAYEAAGFDGYLAKPLALSALASALPGAAGRRRPGLVAAE